MQGTSTLTGNQFSNNSTFKILLEKIRADRALPTLGVAISKVIEIASSEEESVSELAHFILSDVALTQQILRLSNTIYYRTSTGSNVTTISRAIFLLGFDTIKANALSSLLVDGFKDKRKAHSVRKELVQALCASIAAREIAALTHHPNNEEVVVASLFKNIGRILVASFDHHTYERIQTLSDNSSLHSNDICLNLLGCTFQRFGESVLQDWNIPETIIHATQALPQTSLKKASSKADWLKQVASLSEALAQLIIFEPPGQHTPLEIRCLPIFKKFGKALELTEENFKEIILKVELETRQLSICLDITLETEATKSKDANVVDFDFCNEFLLPTFTSHQLQAIERHPSGKPINARDLLLSGVQESTHMIASNQVKINDLILLILETLYTAMGFRFATACLRDAQQLKFISKLSVGENFQANQQLFNFSIDDDSYIFHLAMNNNVDLMISDSHTQKIQDMLPLWFKTHFKDVKSFIILPLVINRIPLGFFYADRLLSANEGVPPDETALIKTLKSQLLSAMIKR